MNIKLPLAENVDERKKHSPENHWYLLIPNFKNKIIYCEKKTLKNI